MLDAIADFWKPVRRAPAQVKLKPEELQIGSTVGFGFVPQPNLSGRRLTVVAINTYQFGADILTSFVLTQEKDAGASMIIAETGGEQYIAISRRISIADRGKIFNAEDIEKVIGTGEIEGIDSKDIINDYKGWIAPHYKREIHHVRGHLHKGDFRGFALDASAGLSFSYTLLVSDNNEHALEIEQYEDGRVEVYATVYRRMSDVGEVSHPAGREMARPDVKLVSSGTTTTAPAKPAPKLEAQMPMEIVRKPEAAPVAPTVEQKAEAAPMPLPEFKPADVVKKEPAPPLPSASHPTPIHVTGDQVKPASFRPQSLQAIAPAAPTSNTAITIQANSQPFIKQEIKAVNNEISNFVNESIDCELHVANKIIDEAIRQEMRINDVVRRVIGLPVSQQESVQIPVTLTDQDYSLLAIRYGINSSDREAIKRRIIEDLGDFSGANKQKKAA